MSGLRKISVSKTNLTPKDVTFKTLLNSTFKRPLVNSLSSTVLTPFKRVKMPKEKDKSASSKRKTDRHPKTVGRHLLSFVSPFFEKFSQKRKNDHLKKREPLLLTEHVKRKANLCQQKETLTQSVNPPTL